MHRLGQDRATYIKQGNVQSFVQSFVRWLVQATQSDRFEHQWVSRKSNSTWSCTDLCDALAKYQWPFSAVAGHPPGSSYAESADVLNTLSANLAAASSGAQLVAACSDVFRWGGVTNGNVSWVTAHEAQLLPHVQQVKKDLQAHLTDSPAPNGMTIGGSTLKPALRFNSGMSKVYSLMVDGLIIYDSRVAAALGMAVLRWAQQCNNNVVPPELAFPWMPAKGAKGQAPNRNPGGGLTRMNQANGQQWAWSALYASMVLGEVSKLTQPRLSTRELEAALFMIGYDVPQVPGTLVVAARPSKPVPSSTNADKAEAADMCGIGWSQSHTCGDGNPFNWRVYQRRGSAKASCAGCAVGDLVGQKSPTNRRLIDVAELVDMFRDLTSWFGMHGHVPLENSDTNVTMATVRAGTAPNGIGRAYVARTGLTARNASRLAAILEDLDLFERRPGPTLTWRLTTSAIRLMNSESPCQLFQEFVKQSREGE